MRTSKTWRRGKHFDSVVALQSDAQEKEKTRAQLELNDPNKPRFTICELKEILRERNELKARVSDLEDELAIYRPTPARNQSVSSPAPRPFGRFNANEHVSTR